VEVTASGYPIWKGKVRESGVSAHEILRLNPNLAPRVTNTILSGSALSSARRLLDRPAVPCRIGLLLHLLPDARGSELAGASWGRDEGTEGD